MIERLKGFWTGIDQALFGAVSPTAFGVFRMLIGFWAFCGLLQLVPNLEALFTERGFVPVAFAERFSEGIVRWNPLVWFPGEGFFYAFFGLTVLAAAMTCLGLFSRIASIALFLGLVALHHRNPDILNSGDSLIRQFTFFLAIGPSGAGLSLDQWRAGRRTFAEWPNISAWPQRLVVFQLAVVYFTTVWWKMMGTKWRDGSATWYPARLNEFDRFPYPQFIDDMPIVMVTTYGTLLVELALATLVFAKPLRKWVILAGLGMHGWIEYSMNIPFFSAIIVTGYVCFYEGDEVERWFGRLSERLGNPGWLTFFGVRGASEDIG